MCYYSIIIFYFDAQKGLAGCLLPAGASVPILLGVFPCFLVEKKHSGLILFGPWPSPGIGHFLKEGPNLKFSMRFPNEAEHTVIVPCACMCVRVLGVLGEFIYEVQC